MNDPRNISVTPHAIQMWKERFGAVVPDLATMTAHSTLAIGKVRKKIRLFMKSRTPFVQIKTHERTFFMVKEKMDAVFVVTQKFGNPCKWTILTVYRLSEIKRIADLYVKKRTSR